MGNEKLQGTHIGMPGGSGKKDPIETPKDLNEISESEVSDLFSPETFEVVEPKGLHETSYGEDPNELAKTIRDLLVQIDEEEGNNNPTPDISDEFLLTDIIPNSNRHTHDEFNLVEQYPHCSGSEIFENSEISEGDIVDSREITEATDETVELPQADLREKLNQDVGSLLVFPDIPVGKKINRFRKIIIKRVFKEQLDFVLELAICKEDHVSEMVSMKGTLDTKKIFYSVLFTTLVFILCNRKVTSETLESFSSRVSKYETLNLTFNFSPQFIQFITKADDDMLGDLIAACQEKFQTS